MNDDTPPHPTVDTEAKEEIHLEEKEIGLIAVYSFWPNVISTMTKPAEPSSFVEAAVGLYFSEIGFVMQQKFH